jgi:hypothetical protein
MKLQAPTSKLQINTKHQAPRLERYGNLRVLDVGYWSFSGAWMMELGAFEIS